MRCLVTPCLMHPYDSAVILFQALLYVKRVNTLVLDIKVGCSDYVVSLAPAVPETVNLLCVRCKRC
jgi:hypothetical protein